MRETVIWYELDLPAKLKGELVIPSAAIDQTFTLQIINVTPVTFNADITVVWSETA